jgi:predicted ABC-type ATPase
MANLYIIAGCNGAGKTTASFTVLPEVLNCKEFVNADEIARGLSPFQPETVAIQAGRLMLKRIDDLMYEKADFAFETTLASRTYVNTIRRAKELGYTVTLLYIWLPSPEMAKKRVKQRVLKGGHNVPEQIIINRYYNGIKNLFELYISEVDEWAFFNSSESNYKLIAFYKKGEHNIIDEKLFQEIKNQKI